MREFGGFLPLETQGAGAGGAHAGAHALATGRSCLTLAVRERRPARVLLPFYICRSVVDAVRAAGARIEYYPIDELLLPAALPEPSPGTMAVLVDYFGLRSGAVDAIAARWGADCIVDRSQAFHAPPAAGSWTAYSARKFYGVADGAYLYAPVAVSTRALPESDAGHEHLLQRRLGNLEVAFKAFQAYEAAIDCEPRRISRASRELLATLDFAAGAERRRANARSLHALLGGHNLLREPLPAGAAPLCYPLLPATRVARSDLVAHRIYTPHFWPEVVDHDPHSLPDWERRLADRLIALPIDHRYTERDMASLAERIRPLLEQGP
jgi:hypothetical protein